MDQLYVMLIIGGIIIALLGLIWSCTTVKTVTIESEKDIKIAERQAERDETLKKIELESVSRTNTTTEAVSKLQAETHRQKNQFDYEIQNKALNVQSQGFETRLGERRLIEEGKSTRTQLNCKTQLSLGELDFEFKNKNLKANVDMFGKQLEYNRLAHERDDNTRRLGLEYTKLSLEDKKKTRRYEADRAFDGLSLTQIHQDNRLKSSLDAQMTMHHERVNLKRDLGTRSIESHERIEMRGFDCRMHEASEMRMAMEIEADKDRDMFSSIVGGVTGLVSGGVIPLAKEFRGLNEGLDGGMRRRTLPAPSGRASGLGRGANISDLTLD